ncbi:MAG: hypothetical protein M3535_06550, partial [Actinomycetota bacterium]|nr:hypothetical protein [Actinomycetota bacterium]
AVARLTGSQPGLILGASVDRIPVGGHVLVSCPPVVEADLAGLTEYVQLEIRRCLEGQQSLLENPSLEVSTLLQYPTEGDGPVEARLLTKVSS